jgi:hypothetical protein
MVMNHNRSSVGTWILIGLTLILGLGTAGIVAVPIARCPECFTMSGPDGARIRRVRVAGTWETSPDAPCDCCSSRGKRGRVTILNYGLSQARHRPH